MGMNTKPLSYEIEMEAECNFSSMSLTSTTNRPMGPKSPPPELLDFYGKRKQMVKIQILEREISLLQEELKSLEGLQPASRCCKELDSFVGSISDPLAPTRKETITKSHHFWNWISSCLLHKKTPKGCACCRRRSSNPKCHGCSSCLKTKSPQTCSCVLKILRPPACGCSLVCSSCKFSNADHRSHCVENCCHTCCQ